MGPINKEHRVRSRYLGALSYYTVPVLHRSSFSILQKQYYLSSLRYLAVTSWPRYHCPCRLLEKKTTVPYIISLNKGYLTFGHYAHYRKSTKFDHQTKFLLHFFLKMWLMDYNDWESNIFIASHYLKLSNFWIMLSIGLQNIFTGYFYL